MKLSKKEMEKFLTPHFVNLYGQYFTDKNEVKKVHFKTLLSPKRFDIAIKYIYAWHKKHNVALEYATEVYKHHIGTWNNFVEGDGRKNCFDDYLKTFDLLLESDFDPNCSLIPVDTNGVIIDGSHRTTACIVNQQNPHVVVIDKPTVVYDYKYFRKLGTDEDILDYAALHYAELDESLFLLFLYPIARSKDMEVESIIESFGDIIYSKELELTPNGMHNLMIQSYKNEHWIGIQANDFAGAKKNAQRKYREETPLQTYLIKVGSHVNTVEIKKQIRALFKYGNDSVHITDNHEQTLRLAQQIYNKNSIYFLNNFNYSKNKSNNILFNMRCKSNHFIPKNIYYNDGIKYSIMDNYNTNEFYELLKLSNQFQLLIVWNKQLQDNLSRTIQDKNILVESWVLNFQAIIHLRRIFSYKYKDTKRRDSKAIFINMNSNRCMLVAMPHNNYLKIPENYILSSDYSIVYQEAEVRYILNHLSNKNTLHMLMYGNPFRYSNFIQKILLFKQRILDSGLLLDDFILVSSSVLGLYGLRKPNDLDFLCIHDQYDSIVGDKIESHHHVEEYYFTIAKEMITDANNYIYFLGLKFLTLDGMIQSNYNRVQNTKKTDIELAKLILNIQSQNNLKKKNLYFLRLLGWYQRIRRNLCLFFQKNKIFKIQNRPYIHFIFCKEPSSKYSLSLSKKNEIINSLVKQIKNGSFESFSIYGVGELTSLLIARLHMEKIYKKINYFIDSNSSKKSFFHNKSILKPKEVLELGEKNFVIVGHSHLTIMINNLKIISENTSINIIYPKDIGF